MSCRALQEFLDLLDLIKLVIKKLGPCLEHGRWPLEGASLHGIFGGDFHAGNLFVVDGGVIGFVDYGMVGRLDHERISFLRYVTVLRLATFVRKC